MFVEIDFAACLARIAPVRCAWTDAVVPAVITPLHGHTYTAEYAWMYAYERSLKARIRPAMGRALRALESAAFGADGALSEVLSNAFLHGNERDARRTIEVDGAVGAVAMAFRVRDQGRGFDVAGALSRLSLGRDYFRVAGNGLRTLARSPLVQACYGDGGRAVTLLIGPGGLSSNHHR